MHIPHWSRHESESHKHKKQYAMSKKLGEGGYAVVYLAHDLLNDRDVAVKVAPKKFVKSADAQKWIMNALTNDLRHPHVVRMLEWWESQHNYNMVYELAAGGELFDRLMKSGPLPEAEVRQVIYSLLDALRYIHSKHIIHRDLKPENVLFLKPWSYSEEEADGAAPVVLTDFGLSVELQSDTDKRYDPCGSPVYAAPEVYADRGARGHSYPADMWSIGVIAFALLSAHYPFENTQLPEVLEEALRGDIHFPDQTWSNISNEAKNFILAMLKVDPELRPTAEQALSNPWMTMRPHKLCQESPPAAGKSPLAKQATLVSITTQKATA